MKRQSAFSIVELILVILIVGVLSVSIVPRFFTQSEVAHYAIRDQFLAQLRLLQLQAMNQRGVCKRLVVTTEYFGIEPNTDATCGSLPSSERRIALGDVVIKPTVGSVTYPFYLHFSSQGLATTDNTGLCSGCSVDIVGDETLTVTIESQGFVHAL
ncbi:type II secretion system protein [Psychrobium sp. 1_MG-2023]|uniref:type II secretion system protein n=1 Tax=Psychrobium sp. 1_MG-2023 TaxID=3062624 RepID=UPI000C32F41D|nr:type II secretion system protein [Psychrobium sp. 1_MG-2023]MDP2560726.1 type II secretion system protein [Psychrobium sp. 1_MG-2023]PKF56618.1 hypothetical protein CW748_09045 [Alteromonadales bacterium alter-6D02]